MCDPGTKSRQRSQIKVFFCFVVFGFFFPPVGLDELGFETKAVGRGKTDHFREIEKHSHKPVLNCSKEPELGSC